jgi:hypothetical protein
MAAALVPGVKALGARHALRGFRLVTLAWLIVALAQLSAHARTLQDSARASPSLVDAYAAAFVAQTVPSFIELFKATSVSVTMRNTGTATWIADEGDVFLATQEPQDNYFWCIQDNPHGMYSGNRVLLPHDVPPGAEVTFDFVVKPLTCGYTAAAPLRFRMLSQTHGTFGDETPAPETYISTASEFVSQQVPQLAPAGASVRMTATFRNTTNRTWQTSDGYALSSAGPVGNTTWGTASIPLAADVAPGALARLAFTITVPRVPGTYNLQWQMRTADGVVFGQASPPTPVSVVAAGAPNYQGLWWANPPGSESGWGINFAHQGDVIFATWFTYDASGKALWLSMSADKTAAGAYAGPVLQTAGPPFDRVPFQPVLVRSAAVGAGTLTFDDRGGGTFAYTLNGGVAQAKSIVRQAFGTLPTCTFALTTDLTRAYNYQDLWWASPAGSEAGWGLNLAHQGDVVFGTWFTFAHDGTPMWLSFTATKTDDAVSDAFTGTVYRTSGPPLASVPFDPGQVIATPVGTAEVAFSNGNAGRFSYTVDGSAGSKAITRQIFATPGTVCQ